MATKTHGGSADLRAGPSTPDAVGPDAGLDTGLTCGGAEVTGVQLSHHPWTDTGFPSFGRHGLIADHRILDAFAREFATEPRVGNTGEFGRVDPEMQDFFLLWLPNRLMNIAAGREEAPEGYRLDMTTAEGFGIAQWLAHLGGYYAAVWLRACWNAFEGPRRDIPARDRWFQQMYARQLDPARAVALHGTDRAAIEFSRGMLRANVPHPARPRRLTRLLRVDRLLSRASALVPGEVGIFGFNAGFLRNILPPGLNAPENARPFTEPYYTSDGGILLDAHFALPEPVFMTAARESWARIEAAEDQVAARRDEAIAGRDGEGGLIARQQSWDTFAAVMYRVGIRKMTIYRGFDQPQYDRLLAWTSYSAMMNVASAYNALTAYATRDAELARQQITASTLWWGFISAYCLGCADGRNDGRPLRDTLPRFVTTDGGTCQ